MLLASYNQTDKNKNDAQLATARRFLEVLLESGMSLKEALKRLSAKERELIEEDKFIEMRKK
jgi:type II secretory pathway component PulF